MGFHVGQLVECVDDSAGPYGRVVDVTRGQIYAISELHDASEWGFPGEVALSLDGVASWGYRATRFRPLTESRLAIFRDLLAPVPTKERERA